LTASSNADEHSSGESSDDAMGSPIASIVTTIRSQSAGEMSRSSIATVALSARSIATASP